MCPAVSMLCGVATMTCLAVLPCACMWALVTIVNNYGSFLLHWSLWITILDSSLLWLPVLFNSAPSPSHPPQEMVHGMYLHWLAAACRAGSCPQGCHGTFLLCLVFLWGPHQPLMAPVPKLIKWRQGYKSRLKHLARGMLRSWQFIISVLMHCIRQWQLNLKNLKKMPSPFVSSHLLTKMAWKCWKFN